MSLNLYIKSNNKSLRTRKGELGYIRDDLCTRKGNFGYIRNGICDRKNDFGYARKSICARQGMIICVPEGNPEDHTRLPEFYDGTYNYLKSIGLKEI